VDARVRVLKLDADEEIGQTQTGVQESFIARGLVGLAEALRAPVLRIAPAGIRVSS
jgi:hypothetical protein